MCVLYSLKGIRIKNERREWERTMRMGVKKKSENKYTHTVKMSCRWNILFFFMVHINSFLKTSNSAWSQLTLIRWTNYRLNFCGYCLEDQARKKKTSPKRTIMCIYIAFSTVYYRHHFKHQSFWPSIYGRT